jgi:small GTP-binding protein
MNTMIQKKICMLGDFSTGKTSLVRRFVYNLFDAHYITTIGVNITRKDVSLPDQPVVRLLIWDMSGSEKFSGTRPSYLQGSAGAILVCDLTRPGTLASLNRYYQWLKDTAPQACVLWIGNKADLVAENAAGKPCEMAKQVSSTAASLHELFAITSAKTGAGVNDAFAQLAGYFLSSSRD